MSIRARGCLISCLKIMTFRFVSLLMALMDDDGGGGGGGDRTAAALRKAVSIGDGRVCP